MDSNIKKVLEFQSTLPVWGATGGVGDGAASVAVFQSTLPVWGATALSRVPATCPAEISIHAPRVGSDHILPVGRDIPAEFQSTLPVWGATADR